MPRPVRLTTRSCSFRRSGSRWFRTSPSTSTRRGLRRMATPTLTLVDTTQTSSWDDWAQGFRSDGVPNMNCPGQGRARAADLFYFTLYNQPIYLDLYNSARRAGRDPRCRTTPSSSAMTACTTGTSSSRRPTTACTSSPASPAMDPTTGKPTRRHELHDLHGESADLRQILYGTAPPCCPPASTWWKWLCLRAMNW